MLNKRILKYPEKKYCTKGTQENENNNKTKGQKNKQNKKN